MLSFCLAYCLFWWLIFFGKRGNWNGDKTFGIYLCFLDGITSINIFPGGKAVHLFNIILLKLMPSGQSVASYILFHEDYYRVCVTLKKQLRLFPARVTLSCLILYRGFHQRLLPFAPFGDGYYFNLLESGNDVIILQILFPRRGYISIAAIAV